MGCASDSGFLEYMGFCCSHYGNIEAYRSAKVIKEIEQKTKLPARSMSTAFGLSKDPAIRSCSKIGHIDGDRKNIDFYIKILQENEISLEKLKKKLSELSVKAYSKIIKIGKAPCGRPCYAFNPSLFNSWPECQNTAKEQIENGTYQKQVYDKIKGDYVYKDYYNEDNICLDFTFDNNVDKWDIDFAEMCDYYDKVDKEKTVHWSCIDDNGNAFEKDMPIHYMMIDGERYDFPYGIGMREFFYMNDDHLFQVNKKSWKTKGYSFSIYNDGAEKKIGKSIDYYGRSMLHMVLYFQCTSCKLSYHVIRTCPLMHRDKSKDPK